MRMTSPEPAEKPGASLWPEWLIPAVLPGFAVVWLTVLGVLSRSPIVDNIEQLTWVRKLAWGYVKHPPLPTILLWPFVELFGLNPWVTYLLGAALTLGAIALMFSFLRRHRGTAHAAIATLAALCVTYTSGSLAHYSHNTTLLFFNMLAAGVGFQALQTRHWRWFVALGVTLGLGALCKYQIAVTVACLLAFVTVRGAWRDGVVRRGLLMAAAVALLVVLPHVRWLVEHDFAPFRYAAQSSIAASLPPAERVSQLVAWLGKLLVERLLPALLLLAFVAWSARRAGRAAPRLPSPRPPTAAAADPVRQLLLCWGLVPMVFMPLMSLVTGAHLQNHWGTAFLLVLPAALMECLPSIRWPAVSPRRVMAAFGLIQALTLIGTASALLRHSDPLQAPWRRLDSSALANAMAPSARAALNGPIRVINGLARPAGAVALQLPERPLVLMDGDFQASPWVSPDLIDRCGMVEILRLSQAGDLHAFGAAAPDLGWRIVLPKAGAGACPPL